MKYLLDELLSRIIPQDIEYQTVSHNGKSALTKSLPNKLRSWNEPGDIRFVVIHDQDNRDCKELKRSLEELCRPCGKRVLIRIACQELESWYFGDMHALSQAYGNERMAQIKNKSKYRVPDAISNPKEALRQLLPDHQQISGAKRVAPFMSLENNTSVSFQAFLSGVQRLIG